MNLGSHQGYLLDTNVLLALLRGNALAEKIDRAFGLRGSLHRHAVSIVTQAELSVIADRNAWGPEKKAALERALESVVVIPIDGAELVNAYAAISAVDSSAKGGARNLGKNDLWIAATALYTNMPLLTTDKDFQFLHGKLLQVMWVNPESA